MISEGSCDTENSALHQIFKTVFIQENSASTNLGNFFQNMKKILLVT